MAKDDPTHRQASLAAAEPCTAGGGGIAKGLLALHAVCSAHLRKHSRSSGVKKSRLLEGGEVAALV